ncbi:phosphatases II [Poronia punctata]|nr:phosphatases II [Poronia punctata]
MDRLPVYQQLATPAAPYTTKPPSSPCLQVDKTLQWHDPIAVVARYDAIDPSFLSAEELSIITQGGLEQVAHDTSITWSYNMRHEAQRVLDYLYLGPSRVVRNHQWLRKEGIAMVLAARDATQAGLNFLAVDKDAKALGIEARYVDVSGDQGLVGIFPSAVRAINEHMLRINKGQHGGAAAALLQKETVPASSVRGKVLVFCETGNERSASIVAAYLMTVFGMTAGQACHFVTHSRFCCGMNESIRNALQVYGDILAARRTVHQYELKGQAVPALHKAKRRIEDTNDGVDDEGDANMTGVEGLQHPENDYFASRRRFVPFLSK